MVGIIEPEHFTRPMSTAGTSTQHVLPPTSTATLSATHTPQSMVPSSTLTPAAIVDCGIVACCSSDQLPTIYSIPTTEDNDAVHEPKVPISTSNISDKLHEASSSEADKPLNSEIVRLSSCAKIDEPQSFTALIPTDFGPVRLVLAIATAPIAQILDTRKLRMLVVGQPLDTIFACLSAWMRCEYSKRYLLETQPSNLKSQLRTGSQTISEPSAEYGALVPYLDHSSPKCILEAKNNVPNSYASNSSLDSFMGSRIFLIGHDNLITCIHYGQLLYDVDVIQDDGESDFDSIASPTKSDLSQVFNDTTSSGSSPYRNSALSTETYANEENHYKFEIEEVDGWVSENEENGEITDESTTGSDDTSSVDTVIRYKVNLHPPDEAPTGKEKTENVTQTLAPMTSNENTPKNPYNATFQREMSSLALPQRIASNTMDAADWTCEQGRMRLGSESLFAFLNVLGTRDDEKATVQSVVAAFLKMVDLEREKRGAVLLPSACTAQRVLSSRILPHTVTLGTTTVAVFMKELHLNPNDKINTVDIYGAWGRLSGEEMRLQDMASKGIMGALKRAPETSFPASN
ncbi:hypothetical protein PtrCC142_011780 [Pyrenophora tritici-repentis]|nr:hypothetical protein PtrSN001C_011793 [Pyrenophora tritici-repentis]KAI1522734.1 hypothetical protein PtrSN001A_011620 [Pyrenophora tritici-repentis]KAI1559628.1 hypothetical protein PtrEW4_011644 [Pyrenophora tritici-repentis]KAI1559660.1 hypothetical protein PtrEW7m1_011816 [Pyrenophora tritici-repentis]KAI1591530.1 hypothetical protein PtrCC142_011780 [Pyrenophora tritici-repentis]